MLQAKVDWEVQKNNKIKKSDLLEETQSELGELLQAEINKKNENNKMLVNTEKEKRQKMEKIIDQLMLPNANVKSIMTSRVKVQVEKQKISSTAAPTDFHQTNFHERINRLLH